MRRCATSRSMPSLARSMPPSTPRSRCCRSSRCATAGTSAASPPTCIRRPAGRRSFIYDGHPGGIGITREGYRRFEELCQSALRALRVPVRAWLPELRAVAEVRGNLNEPLSKAGAILLLGGVLGIASGLTPAEAALRVQRGVGARPRGPRRRRRLSRSNRRSRDGYVLVTDRPDGRLGVRAPPGRGALSRVGRCAGRSARSGRSNVPFTARWRECGAGSRRCERDVRLSGL